ncbi:ADP-ribosylglycohydrolase family protein [Ottowia sp.]|uniref:ADP-ribosylglycohydrolase family protein n=1 Tax=Ottowia sp. TaxID=1898956 RepID=UPI0039481F12
MTSLAERGGYDESDFCQRLDRDFFPLIDGTPNNGPGGYTSQSMREAYRLRVQQGRPWGEVAGWADDTEAAERVLAIAVRDARDLALGAPRQRQHGAHASRRHRRRHDHRVLRRAGPAGAGERFDGDISAKLMARVRDGTLPFHSVTAPGQDAVPPGPERPRRAGQFASPDALIGMGYIAGAALDPDVRIEPAWKVSRLMACPARCHHQFRPRITGRALCRRLRMRRAARHQRPARTGARHPDRRAGGCHGGGAGHT